MTQVTFPLTYRQRGAAVANLQDALLQLLARGAILADEVKTRQDLAAALKGERARSTYGSATREPVRAFQAGRSLEPHGDVDEATATAIISRPSSVVPMEYTRTRGDALANRRMYSYTSLEYGSLLGAPAMSPSTAAGVGMPLAAGM